jgi:hypothetical protein
MTVGMFCEPDGHDWQNEPGNRWQPGHQDEGLTCARCGVTDAELDAMESDIRGTCDDVLP